jgi:putative FmdB family regulatory protein
MPTYEYECLSCHEHVEAVQKFSDPSLTVCPLCQGELRKVYSAVGIVFKGSGFYKNDSRGAKSTATPSSSSTSESSSSESSTPSTTSETTKTAPAAVTPTPAKSSEASKGSGSRSSKAPSRTSSD